MFLALYSIRGSKQNEMFYDCFNFYSYSQKDCIYWLQSDNAHAHTQTINISYKLKSM